MDNYQLFDIERDLSMLMSRVKIGEMIDEATMQQTMLILAFL